jgi:hypothetical protein
MPVDLDQGGLTYQRARVGLGPSLGEVWEQVRPQIQIQVAGTYNLGANTSVVLVYTTGVVNLYLPDVRTWLSEPVYQPTTAFERSIFVKDMSGAPNITVAAFGTQTIDNVVATATITASKGVLRLYPLADQTGWFLG